MRWMKRVLGGLPLLLASGCLLPMPGSQSYGQPSDPTAQTDAARVQQVNEARAAAEAAPGDSGKALNFSLALRSAFQAGTFARGKLDARALVPEALADFDQAAAKDPREKFVFVGWKGDLLLAAGDKAGAVAAYRQSLALQVTVDTLQSLVNELAAEGQPDAVVSECRKVRRRVDNDTDRFGVLLACLKAEKAVSIEGGLAWAPPGDIPFFKKQYAALQEMQQKHDEELHQEEEQRAAEMEQQQREQDQEDRERREEQRDEKRRTDNQFGQMSCMSSCDHDRNACEDQCSSASDEGECRGGCTEAFEGCQDRCRAQFPDD